MLWDGVLEHRMLARLGQIAQERGLGHVEVNFSASGKNQPVLDFLRGVGAEFEQPSETGLLFRFPSAYVAGLSWAPPSPQGPPLDRSPVPHAGATLPSQPARASGPLLCHIATEFYDAEQVLRALAAWRQRPRLDLDEPYVAPRNAVEKTLAAIWSEVLGIEPVGIRDNFFALGGHSLLATQLISRIRDTFRMELSMGRFFERPTVAGLAEVLQVQPEDRLRDPDRIAQLLEMVEQLSEDAVGALLRKTMPAPTPVAGVEPVLLGNSGREMAREMPAPRPASTVITSVVFRTCNRPDALLQGLTSYIENCRRYERTNDFVVMDDTARPDTRREYREMLCELKRRYGVDIAYAGLEEKQQFTQRLIEMDSFPGEVVQFALFDVEHCGNSAAQTTMPFCSKPLATRFSLPTMTCNVALPPLPWCRKGFASALPRKRRNSGSTLIAMRPCVRSPTWKKTSWRATPSFWVKTPAA